MTTEEQPMIWTSHGNLPEASLVRTVSWEDCSDYTKCIVTHRLGDEIVKQSCDVLIRKGETIAALQGAFG